MDTRHIGTLQVSVVGLGCSHFGWRIDADATAAVVHAALDEGVNFFDTAETYGGGESEEFLGGALGCRRNDVIIASKFGMKCGARSEVVRPALEGSLKRLGTDHIDLYQLHRPDPTVPIADTLGAMEDLVRDGKVREIGCSNFSATQLREAARFVSIQNRYSLLHRDPEQDVIPECERLGIAFIPYLPLANGVLAGNLSKVTDENRVAVEALVRQAESQGQTLLELALSWFLSKRAVSSVITGATSPEQIKANAAAANKLLANHLTVGVDYDNLPPI